jgi:hypothetical protein
MAYKHPPRETREDGLHYCTKHNELVLCQSCELDKESLKNIPCVDCGTPQKVWKHPAGHRIVFCDCPTEQTMIKCPDCDRYVSKENKHPHKFYQPNFKMFVKWGYQAY